MKIIALMLIAIIIPLTSFPSSIKAARSGSSGGSSSGGSRSGSFGGGVGIGGGGIGGGFSGGGGGKKGTPGRYRGPGAGESIPDKEAREAKEREEANYRHFFGKPQPGGDTGPSIVVIPKPPAVEMPKECAEPVQVCIQEHIIDDAGEPKYGGSCCAKIKKAAPCLCTFLMSKDPKAKNAAYGVIRGCHFGLPLCIKMPMPQSCRPEVRHCVQVHLYGRAGQPQYGGACCKKFKHAKSCVTQFLNSPDPKLNANANGILRGCRFRR